MTGLPDNGMKYAQIAILAAAVFDIAAAFAHFDLTLALCAISVSLCLVWTYFCCLRENKGFAILGIGISVPSAFIFSILLVHLLFTLLLFYSGFGGVSADEYTRMIISYVWSKQDYGSLLDEYHLYSFSWPPFEFYLNSFLLRVWDDVALVSALSPFIFSAILLFYFYRLVEYVFSNRTVAYLACLMLVFERLFSWMGSTPMADIYFTALAVAGLYHLMVWLKEGRKWHLFAGSSLLLLATGFHLMGWGLVCLIDIALCYFVLQFVRQGKIARAAALAASFILSGIYMIAYTWNYFIHTGSFKVFSNHIEYTNTFLGGADRGDLVSRLAYYPGLLFSNETMVFWMLLAAALFYIAKNREMLLRAKDAGIMMFPLALCAVSLLSYCVFNIFSPPSLAFPDRFVLFLAVLITPYSAYGLYSLWPGKNEAGNCRMAFVFLLLWVMIVGNISQSLRILGGNAIGVDLSGIGAGKYLDVLLDGCGNCGFMVEGKYHDYVAVRLFTMRHLSQIRYDRDMGSQFNNASSILLGDGGTVCGNLSSDGIGYVALISDDLKSRADPLPCLERKKEIGNWTIYDVIK